jgi:hypothetical protein
VAVCILEQRASTIELVPPVRPQTATCVFKSPDGSTLATITATVDNTSRTVASVSGLDVTLDGNLVAGRHYWWTSGDDGAGGSLVRCAQSDANVVRFVSPPAGSAIKAGDTISGARMTALVPSDATATRARRHRAEWTITPTSGDVTLVQQEIHVCRTLFRAAVLPDEAARFVAFAFPSAGWDRPYGYWLDVAERASRRITRALGKAERFEDLIGDYNVFVEAGQCALRIELALEGLLSPGYDLTRYVREQGELLDIEVQTALSNCWYDENEDGAVDEDAEVSGFMSFELVRT